MAVGARVGSLVIPPELKARPLPLPRARRRQVQQKRRAACASPRHRSACTTSCYSPLRRPIPHHGANPAVHPRLGRSPPPAHPSRKPFKDGINISSRIRARSTPYSITRPGGPGPTRGPHVGDPSRRRPPTYILRGTCSPISYLLPPPSSSPPRIQIRKFPPPLRLHCSPRAAGLVVAVTHGHGERRLPQVRRPPALPRDDPGGDRGAGRQERLQQGGHLHLHRGELREPALRARLPPHGQPRQHEGGRQARLRQEQLPQARRRRRRGAHPQAWPRPPAQGPQRAPAAAQGPQRAQARPRTPAQGQGPRRRGRRQGHQGHAQERPRPPRRQEPRAQEGQGRQGAQARPGRRRVRLRACQARTRPPAKGQVVTRALLRLSNLSSGGKILGRQAGVTVLFDLCVVLLIVAPRLSCPVCVVSY